MSKTYKKIGTIKQFGDLWIITANNLIHNEKRSYRSVARQLDVDTKTVKKYANSSMNEKKTWFF
ncbi:TnsD family Tn7-like transposition protein [Peribacillus tepidiphilus]|uniref:TnsD family Tn7-like transposition protein n=1 Tax=Peribacillus tepidiphilus TaxID=2652445 RepID=UPI001CDB765E